VSVRTELVVELPALATSFAATTARGEVVQLAAADDETVALAVRVRDAGDFADELDADPTVEAATRLDDGSEPALFRITVPAGSVTYDAWLRRGGVLENATVSADGWRLCLWFERQPALGAYYDECRDRGLAVDIRHITGTAPSGGPLTECQRELLAAAHEAGYFAIPRETELGAVAERVGISTQAASERLRRGLAALVGDRLSG
jgi:predicted DNA binding protein